MINLLWHAVLQLFFLESDRWFWPWRDTNYRNYPQYLELYTLTAFHNSVFFFNQWLCHFVAQILSWITLHLQSRVLTQICTIWSIYVPSHISESQGIVTSVLRDVSGLSGLPCLHIISLWNSICLIQCDPDRKRFHIWLITKELRSNLLHTGLNVCILTVSVNPAKYMHI